MEPDNHKHQKLLEKILEGSINKEDPFSEWRYVKYTDISGAGVVSKCLCTTPISKFYTIQNTETLKKEIIGSECIRKFVELKCETCEKPLKNIVQRLNKQKLICPECTRIAEKKQRDLEKSHKFAKLKYQHEGHPCNGKPFYKIIQDMDAITELVNNPAYSKSYRCLMVYIYAFCDVT